MPQSNIKRYHTIFRIPSKEEINETYEKLITKIRERSAQNIRKISKSTKVQRT